MRECEEEAEGRREVAESVFRWSASALFQYSPDTFFAIRASGRKRSLIFVFKERRRDKERSAPSPTEEPFPISFFFLNEKERARKRNENPDIYLNFIDVRRPL